MISIVVQREINLQCLGNKLLMKSIIVQCIGIALLMISKVVQCYKNKLAMHWTYIGYDKSNCPMQ